MNNVTHNYTLVKDCFQRFFSESKMAVEVTMDPWLSRPLVIQYLIIRHGKLSDFLVHIN